MKLISRTAALVAAALSIGFAANAATYTIDMALEDRVRQFGGAAGATSVSVTGFIETDVTDGVFDETAITSWSFNISDGVTTRSITSEGENARMRRRSVFEIVDGTLYGIRFRFTNRADNEGHVEKGVFRYGTGRVQDRVISRAVDKADDGTVLDGFHGVRNITSLSQASPDGLSAPIELGLTSASSVAPVPLPAAGFMLLAGLGAFGLMKRKNA